MGEHPSTHTPVTYESCAHIEGPFYHGTKSALEAGAELVPGYGSNFQKSRVSNNIYFTALMDTAVWGAELAAALAGSGKRGRVYVVEPSGPFEDDPNVTNKKFPGNRTQSLMGHAFSGQLPGGFYAVCCRFRYSLWTSSWGLVAES